MRVEMWFDYNKESFETILNLEEALNTFVHAKKVEVFFRSLPKSDENYSYHETFQYGRKKGLGLSYLNAIFNIYFLESDLLESLDALTNGFDLNQNDLSLSLAEKKVRHIVLNQLEHATLQKINDAPTITFSHGFKLFGIKTAQEIKDVLIKMYEKDTGIEYCEENCER